MDTLTKYFIRELEMEAPATRKCLERVPENLFSFKPTEKSMSMKDLATTVASIPAWIVDAIQQPDINFATYQSPSPKTAGELVELFDTNLENAKKALADTTDEALQGSFSLKHGEQTLATDTKENTVGSSINHLAHHRGQLTVYMRLNGIPVPSIYGPSGDEPTWS